MATFTFTKNYTATGQCDVAGTEGSEARKKFKKGDVVEGAVMKTLDPVQLEIIEGNCAYYAPMTAVRSKYVPQQAGFDMRKLFSWRTLIIIAVIVVILIAIERSGILKKKSA